MKRSGKITSASNKSNIYQYRLLILLLIFVNANILHFLILFSPTKSLSGYYALLSRTLNGKLTTDL